MKDFSPAQSKRISETSQEIVRLRLAVQRIEGELFITKENLKIARQELESAYIDLENITNDALAGKEPLPNMFEERTSRGKARHSGTSRLTKALTDSICKMLEIAVPQKYAAEANGMPEKTFEDWMRKGGQGIHPYANFAGAVTRAKAKAVPNMHVRALSGGKGSGAAMWLSRA